MLLRYILPWDGNTEGCDRSFGSTVDVNEHIPRRPQYHRRVCAVQYRFAFLARVGNFSCDAACSNSAATRTDAGRRKWKGKDGIKSMNQFEFVFHYVEESCAWRRLIKDPPAAKITAETRLVLISTPSNNNCLSLYLFLTTGSRSNSKSIVFCMSFRTTLSSRFRSKQKRSLGVCSSVCAFVNTLRILNRRRSSIEQCHVRPELMETAEKRT